MKNIKFSMNAYSKAIKLDLDGKKELGYKYLRLRSALLGGF